MAITFLGAKRLQGLKVDRVVDSLGSSADGANTGIALTPIKTNSSTNKIDFKALRDGVNHALSYDLGATLSDTLWTCRFVINFSKLGSSGNGNYIYVGLSDKDSSTAQNGNQDFIGTQIQLDGTSNYFSNDSDGASISGTGSGDNSQSWTPAVSTNYYVEIIRSSATAYSITIRTGSHSGTSLGTVSGTCATTTVGLRYFKVLNVINSSGGRDLEGTIDTITIDNGASTYSSADYTVNPNSTTGWSGNYKLGTGAYNFSGGSDVVVLPYQVLPTSGDYTIAGWAKLTSASANNEIIRSSDSNQFELWYSNNNGIYISGASGSIQLISDSAVELNKWYHFAFTHDSSGDVSYVDGASTSTATLKTPPSATNWRLGNRSNGSEPLIGQLDDWGVWGRALTATEISDLVNSSLSSETLRIDQTAQDSGDDTMNSSGKVRAGLVITSASFGSVGKVVNKVGYELKKTGSPTGNVTVVVADSSGTVIETVGTLDISTLTTSYAWKYFENSSASHVLANGERIELRYSGGDGSNTLNYRWKDGDVTSHSNYATKTASGSYDNMTGRDPQIKIYDSTLTINGALVSSLSNKAGLKAHYTMDSAGGTEYGSLVLDDVMHWEAGNNSYTEPHPIIYGNKITSGNPLIGKTITSLGFQLYRGEGTTTDTITFAVWDGDSTSTTPRYTFGSMNINDIVTSGSLGSSSPCQLYVIGSSDSGVTIQENDVIGAVHNRESGTYTTPNSVEMGQEDATATYSNGHRAINMRNTSSARSWHEATNKSPYFTTASYCENDSSDASPVANLVNGFIMESTSDGKHYMWNSTTSTWTEVA